MAEEVDSCLCGGGGRLLPALPLLVVVVGLSTIIGIILSSLLPLPADAGGCL